MDYCKYENTVSITDRMAYLDEGYRLRQMFKADAIEEAGLKGHPKAEKAYKLAYERSHSHGYIAVMVDLEELADLIL